MGAIRPKFGEWLRGVWAAETDPQRDGMYVETIYLRGESNRGTWYRLTDGNGDFWRTRGCDCVTAPIERGAR